MQAAYKPGWLRPHREEMANQRTGSDCIGELSSKMRLEEPALNSPVRKDGVKISGSILSAEGAAPSAGPSDLGRVKSTMTPPFRAGLFNAGPSDLLEGRPAIQVVTSILGCSDYVNPS